MSKRVEVRTRTYTPPDGGAAQLLMECHILPRGGANWKVAADLAEQFRQDKSLSPHIIRCVAGKSKVSVYFRVSLGMMKAVWSWRPSVEDPDQLPLFSNLKGA